MENLNIEYIRKLVLSNTLRTLKNHKVYYIFRCFIQAPKNSPYYALNLTSLAKTKAIAKKYNGDNPFNFTNKPDDILSMMASLERDFIKGEPDLTNPKEIQRIVMIHINNLLHFCVERGVKDISIMETLGRETFEKTCKNIFGDNFVDEMDAMSARSDLDSRILDGRAKELIKLLNGRIPNNQFIDALFNAENGRSRIVINDRDITRNIDLDFIDPPAAWDFDYGTYN